jgi:hypothetical protein
MSDDITAGAEFHELLRVYRSLRIEFSHLKDITFAQWAHESGFGASRLARLHKNFAGMKWRPEMSPIAHKVYYRPDHDPVDTEYCGFPTLEAFVRGYWRRLDLPSLPYAKTNGGWRAHSGNPSDFIEFIGPIWAPEGGDNSPLNSGYIRKVRAVLERLSRAGLLPSSRDRNLADGESRTTSLERATMQNAHLRRLLEAAGRDLPDKEGMSSALKDLYAAMGRGEARLSEQEVHTLLETLVSAEAVSPPEGVGDLRQHIREIVAATKDSGGKPRLPPDLLTINRVAEVVHGELAGLPRPLDSIDVDALVNALRDARAFDWLVRICDRLILTGHDRPLVRRYYAQGLVDSGQIVAGLSSLEALKREQLAKEDMDEVLGQIGRAHKQIYVNHVKTAQDAFASRHRFAPDLKAAILHYGIAYDPQRPGENHWHGINLIALLKRAEADGVRLDQPPDADALARGIIAALEPNMANSKDDWELASLADAYLALGEFQQAERFYRRFAEKTSIDAFKLASTIRQLEEVWRANGDGGAARGSLVTLKAALAGRRHAAFGLSRPERQLIRSDIFESNFPDGEFIFHGTLRRIVRAGEAIGCIKDRHRNNIGTGFLVRGSQLAAGLGDEPYLLTNAHVICDPEWPGVEMDQGALRPGEALIEFEAADEASPKTYRLEPKAVWLSPSSECDACLLRFKEPPERVAVASIALRSHELTYGQEDNESDGTPVAVLGHAGGRGLQLGVRGGSLTNHRGSIVDMGPRQRSVNQPVYLHYDSPTLDGNSGSPVYDTTTWEVVGLHHAGYDATNGRARLRGRGAITSPTRAFTSTRSVRP